MPMRGMPKPVKTPIPSPLKQPTTRPELVPHPQRQQMVRQVRHTGTGQFVRRKP